MVSASEALEAMLQSLELDKPGDARAAIARALAAKLDEARDSDSATSALAIAGIARELREVIDAILESSEDDAEWVNKLLSPMGDATDADKKDTGRSSSPNRRSTRHPADAVATPRARRSPRAG